MVSSLQVGGEEAELAEAEEGVLRRAGGGGCGATALPRHVEHLAQLMTTSWSGKKGGAVTKPYERCP